MAVEPSPVVSQARMPGDQQASGLSLVPPAKIWISRVDLVARHARYLADLAFHEDCVWAQAYMKDVIDLCEALRETAVRRQKIEERSQS